MGFVRIAREHPVLETVQRVTGGKIYLKKYEVVKTKAWLTLSVLFYCNK